MKVTGHRYGVVMPRTAATPSLRADPLSSQAGAMAASPIECAPGVFLRIRQGIAVLALLCPGACAGSGHADSRLCAPNAGVPMLIATLYFGLPAGADAEQGWQTFVDRTIVADLPDGFTVTDAQGGWRNPRTAQTVRERSKMLIAVIPDTADRRGALDRIRRTYEQDFHQQIVGLTTTTGCADFQPRPMPRRPE